jgi:PadR family transcriptional regulator
MYFYYNTKEMEKREDLLGALEHLILLAVMRLADNAYGITVQREIEQASHRSLSLGAVYSTLMRLEAKRLISSVTGDPTPERGGRAKRYYSVTPAGRAIVGRTQDVLVKLSAGLEGLELSS